MASRTEEFFLKLRYFCKRLQPLKRTLTCILLPLLLCPIPLAIGTTVFVCNPHLKALFSGSSLCLCRAHNGLFLGDRNIATGRDRTDPNIRLSTAVHRNCGRCLKRISERLQHGLLRLNDNGSLRGIITAPWADRVADTDVHGFQSKMASDGIWDSHRVHFHVDFQLSHHNVILF